ncbi:MAG: universal stress protein A [Myxococcota bacterium]|jgi:universal stress protein A
MLNTMTYKRILCAIDFSDCSRQAFYVALKYSQLFEAEAVLLHVREKTVTADGLEQNEEELVALERGIRRRLDELAAQDGITAEQRKRLDFEVRGGKPWVEITSYANDNEVDLIIMGTHGTTNLLKSLIGSQAERVVRRANCHVLVVKPAGFDATQQGIPERFRV